MNNLFLAGANRGGKELTRCYAYNTSKPSMVEIADPKPERAVLLADRWNKMGVRASGYPTFCEDIIMNVPSDYIGMLTVDTVHPMVDVLDKRHDIPIQWQIIGQGTGSHMPVLGFSGTVVRDDQETRQASSLFLDNLSPYASTVSSRHITKNVLNAYSVAFTRSELSQHSAGRLSNLNYEPDDIIGGRLNLFFGTKIMHMVIVHASNESFKDTEKKAIEIDSPFIDQDSDFAVALVHINRVEIFIVEKRRRGRGIQFHTTFGDISVPDSYMVNLQNTAAIVTD
ncbi:hypothetical protein JXL19_03930 [bacterium]|nr:hypothetical protein [bacterium]